MTMISKSTFDDGFRSIENATALASPKMRLACFAMAAREVGGWIAKWEVDEQAAVDKLYKIAVAASLVESEGEDAVREAIAAAVEPPFMQKPPADAPAFNGNKLASVFHPSAEIKPLRGLTVDTLAELPVPEREWHVPDLISANVVTLLSGDGGVGKSILALQLAAATAARKPWLGRDTTGGRALFISAEDDGKELHRRSIDVAKAMEMTLSDLGDLMILPLTDEEDTFLAVPDGKSEILRPTPLWNRVATLIKDWRPVVIVFDPRADLFGGNENSRLQARQFLGMLRQLAGQHQTTVVLLDHPSLTGISSGSGLSGTTAWNNSVRSRLYLQRVTVRRVDKGEVELDTDRRKLTNKKQNYGKSGVKIALRWRAGVFVLDDGTAREIAEAPQNALTDRLFVDLVRKYHTQGREVGAKPSPNYAPSVFSKDAEAKGIGKRALAASMNRLLDNGQIAIEEFGPPSKRGKRLVVVPGEST